MAAPSALDLIALVSKSYDAADAAAKHAEEHTAAIGVSAAQAHELVELINGQSMWLAHLTRQVQGALLVATANGDLGMGDGAIAARGFSRNLAAAVEALGEAAAAFDQGGNMLTNGAEPALANVEALT